MLALWRQHFVLEDNLLQIECTTLTTYPVLKASGHVDKFEDLMVKDSKTGECYRADKLLEDFIDNLLTKDKEMTSARREELRKIAAQAGAFKKDQLAEQMAALGITAPATGNPLTPPFEFNLMFTTSIGPTGDKVGFLRPETAQGMFVNFRRLYEYNNGRLPMGVAQIGNAYRNEIAPRGGLLRVREFQMAEIEYFVAPDNKNHVKFDSVADMRLTLFPGEAQTGDGKTISPTLREAVATGIINNQTLAYFMARTAAFLLRIGIKPEGLRFRQHLRTEMAHYACDCWDAEILMSSGWIECVGIADRSAYDLEVHTKATKVELVAREAYPEPITVEAVAVKMNKGVLGKTFKTQQGAVGEALTALAEDKEKAMAFQGALTADGSAPLTLADGSVVTITKDMASFAPETRKVSEKKFTPNVIEPSFGIGRILTGVLEHTFSVRAGDEQRCVLSFKPAVAPYKAVVLPVDNRIAKAPIAAVASTLTRAGLAAIIDDSGASIGKRYSRCDEIGVPFGVTYDHESAASQTVTIRERDTCAQIRVPIADLTPLLRSLVDETSTWAEAMAKYPVVTTGEDKAATAGSTATTGGGGAAAPAKADGPAATSATAATGGAAAASSSSSASAASAAAPIGGAMAGKGTVPLVLEGADRTCGRFLRPTIL